MKKLCEMMMKKYVRRAVSALLALVLLFGMLPASVAEVFAASWMDEYIEKVVDWGVMRGDVLGNLNAEEKITRAEFVTMVNRAFGYTADTTHPFTDVYITDWYNNDIGIAYNMGYFKGTGENTADPNSYLTREQAVVLIGRNLLLEEKASETLGFTDSRSFNDWSRGMVESAISAGYVNGYEDGSFLPQKNVSRGEVAAMLVKAIGTMVYEPGTHSLGGVYGNVMISTSGVTLKNTTIAGNLYITGGLELGDILLDNVVVLGKIIVSGAGESHKGDSSIILRNVESGELVIDSIANQFVTLRAEGDTEIDFTNVKTSAYLDDQTASGDGLLYVELNGESGMTVTMAGNIEEVMNRTPESLLMIAEGTAQFVTIDENAIGSQLEVRNIASIEELNMDIGVPVTGEGDIAEVNINAAGAVVDILPDDINIRPGLEAVIAGEEMDTKDADESSADPRILAGYPRVKNIAPTSADVVFQTNKKGTLYWALTNLIDGPVSAEDLIEEKDYKTKIIMQGSLNVTASETDIRTKLTKLTEEGTYYVSAVLVDSRGQQSAVKYITFTTPDGTAPKFANGYPELTLVKMDYAQVSVMSTKSSVLYYAVLPKGAGAPTINEFKSGAISGDLGNCPKDGIPVNKNVIRILNVCEEGKLEEKVTYELYLCLIDPDNGKDSGIKKITFTTVDGTPPVMEDAIVSGVQKNNVNLSTYLNEAGTIFWVAVKAGVDYLGDADPASRKAVLQVANGMGNIVKAGKSTAKENAEVTLKVNGLEPESSYDVYYVAQDKAGNYSEVKMINVNTLDTVAPQVRQEFTKTADAAGENPLAETDIMLIFSENIRDKDAKEGQSFFELYKVITDPKSTPQEVVAAQATLVEDLEKAIQLWDVTNLSTAYQVKHDPDATADDIGTWINYEKVKMEMTDEGDLVLTFEHGKAVSLSSGSTYHFVIEDITDNSNNKNPIKPNPYNDLPEFDTVFAQVNLTSRASSNVSVDGQPIDRLTGADADADMRFWLDPQSTNSANSNVYYDIWFETKDIIIHFDLYCRVINPTADKGEQIITIPAELSMFAGADDPDQNGWIYLGNMYIRASGGVQRSSVNDLINGSSTSMPQLNSLRDEYIYEFVIDVTAIDEKTDEESWSADVKLDVLVPADQDLSSTDFAKADPQVEYIGNPEDFSVTHKFIDTKTPKFRDGYPTFSVGDSAANMNIVLDRSGTLYYVVAPLVDNGLGLTTSIPTTITDAEGNELEFEEWFKLNVFPATTGKKLDPENPLGKDYILATPTPDGVSLLVDRGADNTDVKTGKAYIGNSIHSVKVEGLIPETTYIVYCLLKGESQSLSKVHCFQFTTNEVTTPTIELNLLSSGSGVQAKTSTDAELSWVLYTNTIAESLFGGSTMLFKNYLADNVTFEAYSAACDLVTKKDPNTITVLDALMLSMSDKRSIFDAFGNEYIKDYVLQRIQMEASSYQQPTDMGDKSFRGGIPDEIEPGNMSEEVVYYIIAAARNTMGQTYGFKAKDGLHLSDVLPPELRDPYTSIDGLVAKLTTGVPFYTTLLSDARKEGAPEDYLYQGSVEITFSERIYQLLATGDSLETERFPITEKNLGSKMNMDRIKLNTDSPNETDGNKNGIEVSGGSIRIFFIDAQIGSYITIFNEGSICDSSGNVLQQGARLRLTLVAELTPDDEEYRFAKPTFLVSWVK